MNSPLHAAYYADQARQYSVTINQNEPIARDTYRLRFDCPELAANIRPGQFLMLRLANYDDPLLGRPLALYDTILDSDGAPLAVDVVYLVMGKLTTRLSKLRLGHELSVWGPLGNGFEVRPTEHLIMVAGGIGQTPFLALAKQYLGRQQYGRKRERTTSARQVTFCYGSRSECYLAGLDDFREIETEPRIATDDGTAGHHGPVTDVLQEVIDGDSLGRREIACCGPEPMMEAVSRIAARHAIPCQVSLETPMACGIGICFSCVAKVKDHSDQWDYKRTCVEGPVFDSTCIVW